MDKKTSYLAPHQETSEMIDQLFQDILSSVHKRPTDVESSENSLHRYVSIKKAMEQITGLFTWRQIQMECRSMGHEFSETQIKDQINFFIELKKCRVMADLTVGDTVEKVYLHES